MNLPPMNHSTATRLAEQLKLLGSGWFDLLTDEEAVHGRSQMCAALLYMADYASALEGRLAELVDLNKDLSGMLQSRLEHPSAQAAAADMQPWQRKLFHEALAALEAGERFRIVREPHRALKIVSIDGTPTNGAVWVGDPSTYTDHMEAINRDIVRTFFEAPPTPQPELDDPNPHAE